MATLNEALAAPCCTHTHHHKATCPGQLACVIAEFKDGSRAYLSRVRATGKALTTTKNLRRLMTPLEADETCARLNGVVSDRPHCWPGVAYFSWAPTKGKFHRRPRRNW